jgi:hypothetical protein
LASFDGSHCGLPLLFLVEHERIEMLSIDKPIHTAAQIFAKVFNTRPSEETIHQVFDWQGEVEFSVFQIEFLSMILRLSKNESTQSSNFEDY